MVLYDDKNFRYIVRFKLFLNRRSINSSYTRDMITSSFVKRTANLMIYYKSITFTLALVLNSKFSISDALPKQRSNAPLQRLAH